MKLYGIKLDGKPLGWLEDSNEGGEYCVGVRFMLDKNGDIPWLVTMREQAESAMIVSEKWFNASYTTPTNPYLGKALEVYEVDFVV